MGSVSSSRSASPRPFILGGPDAELIRVVIARGQGCSSQRADGTWDETRVPTPQPPNKGADRPTNDERGARFPSRDAQGMEQILDAARDLVQGAISTEVTPSGTTPFTSLRARMPWRPMGSPPATTAR
jgi:hypothetical protein